jgi:phosphomannomutase
LIEKFNPAPAYFNHLRTLVDLDAIAAASPRVIHDAMHGAGRSYVKNILGGMGVAVHEIRGEMNPGFNGIHPEPLEKYLAALVAAIQSDFGSVGLATDGDADRIGAMDGSGRFVDPHRIFALVLRYLARDKSEKGIVVRTVSTTRMIDRLCARYGLTLRETPVGYNHIADLMMAEDVLIGGEESGGISVRGHIPEGDGVLMGLLLLEVIAKSGMSLEELVEDIHKDVGPCFYARTDLRLRKPVEKKVMVGQLKDNAPPAIDGLRVVEVSALDGVKYIMDDDSWLLIRPSGTEPVLRVYAEGRSEDAMKSLLGFGEHIAAGV